MNKLLDSENYFINANSDSENDCLQVDSRNELLNEVEDNQSKRKYTKSVKKTFIIKELRDSEFQASTVTFALRKAVRKLVKIVKDKNPKMSIFDNDKFQKNFDLTIIEKESQKKFEFKVSIIKNVTNEKKSMYYQFDYNILVYKRLALL